MARVATAAYSQARWNANTGRLHLVPLVGVEHAEGVRGGRGDPRGAGRRAAAAAASAASRCRSSAWPRGAARSGSGRRPPCTTSLGVAVQAQQQADLVPGRVLGRGRRVGGEAVDEGLRVVRVARR